MKIGIFYRDDNSQSVRLIRKFKRLLFESKMEYVEFNGAGSENADNVDIMVVFGGDGTVLSASKIALDKIPVVAVNTGTVGFLTSFEKEELEQLVKAIKNKTLVFTDRRMLFAEVGTDSYYALNDVVVLKDFKNDDYSCCIKLDLKINDKNVDKYLADGLIISTATGSTAYALSAGAPIITPDLEAVVVAPICPHSLHSRPIVFAPSSVAEVSVSEDSRKCALYIDGERIRSLDCSDKVQVKLIEKSVKICDNCNNFFEKLSKKISSWSNNN